MTGNELARRQAEREGRSLVEYYEDRVAGWLRMATSNRGSVKLRVKFLGLALKSLELWREAAIAEIGGKP